MKCAHFRIVIGATADVVGTVPAKLTVTGLAASRADKVWAEHSAFGGRSDCGSGTLAYGRCFLRQIGLAPVAARSVRVKRRITEAHAANLLPHHVYQSMKYGILGQFDGVHVNAPKHGAARDTQRGLCRL